MDITKILSILNIHIVELEEKLHYREIEIDNLKRKINRYEEREKEWNGNLEH